jgi:hypothetical protein
MPRGKKNSQDNKVHQITIRYSEPEYVRVFVDGIRTDEFTVFDHDRIIAGVLSILEIDARITTQQEEDDE